MAAKQTKKAPKLKKVRRHLRLAIIPHAANHYRPHLIRRYGLVAVVAFVLLAQLIQGFGGAVLGEKAPITVQSLLDTTNSERAAHQQPPLKLNEKLARAAELKAGDMIESQYWAHTSPKGTTPWVWFNRAGYRYSAAGENLAKNFYTANAAVAAWMASPEHRANVLGAFTEVGFAVVEGELDGKDTSIIIAHYGAPSTIVGVAMVSAPSQSLGPVTRLGVTIRTFSPLVLGSMAVLVLAAGVAIAAHAYRSKLPKRLRTTLYRHHGLAKAGGLLGIAAVVLLFQSGGQI